MEKTKRSILIAIVGVMIATILTTSAFALWLYYRNVGTTVHVLAHGFEIYADENCTVPLSTWNIGDISILDSPTLDIYLKNVGSFTLNTTWDIRDETQGTAIQDTEYMWLNLGGIDLMHFSVANNSAIWKPSTEKFVYSTEVVKLTLAIEFLQTIPQEGIELSFNWYFDAVPL
jgi:hypothetical protein